jgi:hypothetical protein
MAGTSGIDEEPGTVIVCTPIIGENKGKQPRKPGTQAKYG